MAQNDKSKQAQRDISRARQRERISTRARRRSQMRKRRQILLGVGILVVVLIAVIILAVSGIFDEKPERSTLQFLDDGSVVYLEMETLDDEIYDAGEIKSFAKEQIKTYNGENEGEVKLEKFKMMDKETAYMKVRYDSFDTYLDFTGFEGFLGTISEAQAKGYDLEAPYIAIDEKEETTSDSSKKEKKKGKEEDTKIKVKKELAENVLANTSAKILVLREYTTVQIGEKILYVTEDGATFLSPNEVQLVSSGGNPDATALSYIIYE